MVEALKNGPLSKAELAKAVGHKSVSGELKKQLKNLVKDSWVEFTLPEKPNSRLQKYRLVDAKIA